MTQEWKRNPETGAYKLKAGTPGTFKVLKQGRTWVLSRKRKGKAKKVIGEFPTLTAAKAEALAIVAGG